MKVVAFSDLHAHPFKNGQVLADGRNSRVDDAVSVITQVYDYADSIEEGAVVLFGGDLFDRRKSIDVDTYNKIHSIISDRSKSIFTLMIPGNHDQANKSGSIHALERFCYSSSSGGCKVVSEPAWVCVSEEDGLWVFAVPYVDDGEVIAASVSVGLQERPRGVQKALLLLHYGVQGAKVGPSDYVLPCELELNMLQPELWDLILSGHYHISQQIGAKFHYIGSAMQHRWDDVGFKKSFMVIDSKTLEFDRVPTVAPEFLVITGKTKEYDVDNCFVKIVRDYEIDLEKKERLTASLFRRGARSVVYEFLPRVTSKDAPERIVFSEDRGVFGMVEDYISSDLIDTSSLDIAQLTDVGKVIIERASVC